jgi:transglutaminase-like putative cysteine protease
MSRRGLTVAILLVWLVAIGLLVRRELWRPEGARLAEAALTLPPGATYYAVLLGDTQIGYASRTIDTLPDTLTVTDIMAVDVPVPGALQRTETRTVVELSRSLQLRSFDATVRGPHERFAVTGHVGGNGLLTLELADDQAQDVRRIALTGPITLPQLLPLQLAYGGELTVQHARSLRLFDPVLVTTSDVVIDVTAESTFVVPHDTAVFDTAAGRWVPIVFDTVRAWHVRQTGGAAPMDAWIDGDGQLVEARSPGGFRLARSGYELVYENYRLSGAARATGATSDVVRSTAIDANAALAPAPTTTLAVRLTGQPLDQLDLDGGRQRLQGDTVIVQREAGSLRAPYRLPDVGPGYQAFLNPEPLIESDDPRIQAQARQITGNTRRPERAAERLVQWVHTSITPAASSGGPSALDVYQRRSGDSNEHTVLYVALARAVGLPARTAAGFLDLNGTFYYHAWPEVWLGEWVAVDPTLGQFPADAAHLRLKIGALARPLELLRLAGQLQVQIVQAGSTS